MSLQLFSKPSNRWIMGLAIAATAITGASVFYGVSQFVKPQPVVQQTVTPFKPTKPSKVTALGRLEPQTELLKLSCKNAVMLVK